MFFINPLIGAGLNIINLYAFTKLNKKGMKETATIEEANSYLEKAKTIDTMFQNCRTFLNAHTNYELEYRDEELTDDNLRKVDLANEHIEIAIMNGQVGNNIPEEIQAMMISLLQTDLQTDETNLEKLMHMVIERELGKSLENNGEMRRIREKNPKKEEK